MTNTSIKQDRSLYRFILLRRERIDMAYPLVRDSGSAVSLNQWRAYAQSLVIGPSEDIHLIDGAGERGIIVAEAPANYIRGLVAYNICGDLMFGRRLNLDYIAVPDSFDRLAIANALSAEFERFAKETKCHSIVIPLKNDHSWLNSYFRGNGYDNAKIQVRSL